MNSLMRGLMWPIVSLVVIGGTHLLAEAIRPALRDVFVPAVVMPVYLFVGACAAVRTVDAGGSFVYGAVAGAILGLLPVALQLVAFGAILGRDDSAVTSAAVLGFLGIFWGGLLGSGYAISRSGVSNGRS